MTDAFAPLSDDSARPRPDPQDGECVMPAPAGSPTLAMRHPELGTPVREWAYRDAYGGLLGVAARFEHNGRKDIRYYTLWRIDGRTRWRCKHWPKPKPIYGQDRLTARACAPVVVCEGEKACDAAGSLMPDHVAVCWPSGAQAAKHADWRPLADRDVIIWPDFDEPGWKAARVVASCLRGVQARRVRYVNRELLASATPLAVGDDASDLLTRDGWDAARMAAFLAMPDALIEAPSGDDDDQAADYRKIVDGVEKYLTTHALTVDATGRWRRAGTHARLTSTATIAKDFAFNYRFTKRVPTTIAIEVTEHLARKQALAALEAIKLRLIGRPVTDSGQIALARWIYAVTGHQDEEVLLAMLHWLWLVKRSLAGLPRAHDLMPILYGAQGGGKSTAVAKMVSPWLELSEPINAELLTENRRAPELERFAIGIWDEMEGAGKADIEALKNTITCESKAYRPMGTNDVAHVHRMMCFIGTSNKPVESMVRDTTGARRFFQIDCQPLIDWEAVNSIDYTTLWSAISELDQTPLAVVDLREAVQTWQGRSRGRDNVNEWIGGESWDWFDWQPAVGIATRRVPQYDPTTGDAVEDIRARYFRWCRESGEQPIPTNSFGQRLKQEGFEYRLVWAKRNQRRYFRPSTPTSTPRAD